MTFNKTYFLLSLLLLLFSTNHLWSQYSVTTNPSSATVNDNITITFTDADVVNDFYTDGQTTIYLYGGVETSAGAWQSVHGMIDNTATLGAAATTGTNGVFSINIDPVSYFGLANGTQVLGINLLFINQWGPGGNNQTGDLYIDLTDAVVGDGGGSGGSTVTVTPSMPCLLYTSPSPRDS